jgi:hypothetical protein
MAVSFGRLTEAIRARTQGKVPFEGGLKRIREFVKQVEE